jgi:hypothetical protein
MSIVEMVMFLIGIGYHPDDLSGYSNEEIKESYLLETK